MSLINDMLRDLEARDVEPPARPVAHPSRQRPRVRPGTALAGLGIVATGLLAAWLIGDFSGREAGSTSTAESLLAAADTPPGAAAPEVETTQPSAGDRQSVSARTDAASKAATEPAPDSTVALQHRNAADNAAPEREPGTADPPPQQESPLQQRSSPQHEAPLPTSEQSAPAAASSDADEQRAADDDPPRTGNGGRSASDNIVVRPAGRSGDATADGLDSARRALSRGQSGLAITRLERLLERDPDAPEARILLARALLATDRVQRAERVLDEGLARNGEHHELAFRLARSRLDRDRARAALEVLERHAPGVDTSVEGAIDYHLLIAATLRQLGRHEPALEAYRRVTEVDPGNTRAWLGRALSAEALDQPDAARAAYRHVLDGGDERAARLARMRLNALGTSETPNP